MPSIGYENIIDNFYDSQLIYIDFLIIIKLRKSKLK